MSMEDNSLMPFGKYQGKEMSDVPDKYLLWFWGENKELFRRGDGFELNGNEYEVMLYIEDSFSSKDLN